MANIRFFKNGFKGIDSGANPAILKDGFSPNCLNWMPVDGKFGVHGPRKGSVASAYYNGYPVRQLHTWVTRQGTTRSAVINNVIDTGSRPASEIEWEAIDGDGSAAFTTPDASFIGMTGGNQYYLGNEAFEDTYPPSYDEDNYSSYSDTLFQSTIQYSTLGSGDTPLSSYDFIKIKVHSIYGGSSIGSTMFGIGVGNNPASLIQLVLGKTDITFSSPPEYIDNELTLIIPNRGVFGNSVNIYPWIIPENSVSSGAWNDVAIIQYLINAWGYSA